MRRFGEAQRGAGCAPRRCQQWRAVVCVVDDRELAKRCTRAGGAAGDKGEKVLSDPSTKRAVATRESLLAESLFREQAADTSLQTIINTDNAKLVSVGLGQRAQRLTSRAREQVCRSGKFAKRTARFAKLFRDVTPTPARYSDR